MPGGADRDLRHFERDAVVACGSMAIVALLVSRGLEAPLGVLAGGLLMALSYLAVKGGVDALVGRRGESLPSAGGREAAVPPDPFPGPPATPPAVGPEADGDATGGAPEGRLTFRQRILGAVKFFTRYALLAVAAYVMLSCFRLHPIGLVAGAASPFVAAIAQVVRISRAPV